MSTGRPLLLHRRFALWWLAAALLLEAAVPMLASAAAASQGKALVEVCTTYGVATLLLDGDAPAAAHGDDCALAGLLALPVPPAAAFAMAALPAPRAAEPAPPALDPARDDVARWVARLKHGPPSSA